MANQEIQLPYLRANTEDSLAILLLSQDKSVALSSVLL